MSMFEVRVTQINRIDPHPNADRLELATVKDWQCVVGKGTFRAGDLCVYIPIDSMLPDEVMAKVYGGSKLKPSSRVRTIKLRGAISQGIAIRPDELDVPAIFGLDVAKRLGITKYEPQIPTEMAHFRGRMRKAHPDFRKYTGIENAKNHPNVFGPAEEVVVTEKIHGTSFRAGYVPFYADTLWKKIKKVLRLAPKFEFVFGGHNAQLVSTDNVYAEAVEMYRLKKLLQPGEVIYGEVYGHGVQKGYTYGLGDGARRAVFFDVMVDGAYQDPLVFEKWAAERDLPRVPILYRGMFDKDKVKALTLGPSVLAKQQKVREGVVVKPMRETKSHIGRKVLKYISDEYLLRDQTDFH